MTLRPTPEAAAPLVIKMPVGGSRWSQHYMSTLRRSSVPLFDHQALERVRRHGATWTSGQTADSEVGEVRASWGSSAAAQSPSVRRSAESALQTIEQFSGLVIILPHHRQLWSPRTTVTHQSLYPPVFFALASVAAETTSLHQLSFVARPTPVVEDTRPTSLALSVLCVVSFDDDAELSTLPACVVARHHRPSFLHSSPPASL